MTLIVVVTLAVVAIALELWRERQLSIAIQNSHAVDLATMNASLETTKAEVHRTDAVIKELQNAIETARIESARYHADELRALRDEITRLNSLKDALKRRRGRGDE
jgi:hypothetical protein